MSLDEDQRRAAGRRTAWIVGAIAFGVYLTFIVSTLLK